MALVIVIARSTVQQVQIARIVKLGVKDAFVQNIV